MKKVKKIDVSGYESVNIDEKINKFLEENNVDLIDIKYVFENGYESALIIYEGGRGIK